MKRLALLALVALTTAARADYDVPKSWTAPTPPFRIVGNIYYVGTAGLAAYLIVDRDQAVLVDATMAENVPQIEANIRTLGMPLHRIKVLLNTHAHFDHSAGLAQLKRDTGARVMALGPDVWALEHRAINVNGQTAMPPVRVDHVLKDGETVRVGRIRLTAIATPGHTAGCTSWATDAVENGRTLRVVIPCSLTVAGNVLVDNPTYPGIVADYRRSFARMAALKADVVLPAHPELADVIGRARRRDAGDTDAFLTPDLLPKMAAAAKAAFEAELARTH
jgi:metallo-beta-lactamase class B